MFLISVNAKFSLTKLLYYQFKGNNGVYEV